MLKLESLGISKEYLYQEYVSFGKSTFAIAEEVGCNASTICNYLKKFSIEVRHPRPKRETIVFNGIAYHRYPESKTFTNRAYYTGSIGGKTVRLHQTIYENQFGAVPKGFHVHHKDGNTLNNSINNLVLASVHDHHSHHTLNNSDNLYKGKRKFWDNQKYREVECPECGKKYNTRSTRDVKFCSSNCWNIYHYRLKSKGVD